MSKWNGFAAICGLLALLACWGSVAIAQEPDVKEEEPAQVEEKPVEEQPVEEQPATTVEQPAQTGDEPAATDQPVDVAPTPTTPKKKNFGLYLGFIGGTGTSDPLNSGIAANELNQANSSLELKELTVGAVAIGWKLANNKGAFRLVVEGVRESSYEYLSQGTSVNLGSGIPEADLGCPLAPEGGQSADCLVPWWFINIKDGAMTSTRLVPMWEQMDDLDGDLVPDFGTCMDEGGGITRCGEIRYDTTMPDRQVTGQIADDLQNRIQTYDFVYGREFGGRRFSSRWWGGLRYFIYEGQLLASAWLNLSSPGKGFTDGAFLRHLSITQKTTGAGPVGAWEADFNFFNRGLVLYMRAEAAFTLNSMKIDSGPFFQILETVPSNVLLPDRMSKTLEKSTWQDRFAVGGRVNLKNGLTLEAGFSITGYLDLFLMPDLLQVGVTNDNPQTFTQDLVINSFYVGAGYQF